MACTLASTRSLTAQRAGVRSARPSRGVVVLKAFSLGDATDWVAKGFMKIFSPPESTIDPQTTNWAENNFKGKISHAPKCPFKDGWSAVEASTVAPTEALMRDDAAAEGYLDGAVKRLVNNNFTGDATEPDWTNNSGWQGDIHKGAKRDARDGFHSKKL